MISLAPPMALPIEFVIRSKSDESRPGIQTWVSSIARLTANPTAIAKKKQLRGDGFPLMSSRRHTIKPKGTKPSRFNVTSEPEKDWPFGSPRSRLSKTRRAGFLVDVCPVRPRDERHQNFPACRQDPTGTDFTVGFSLGGRSVERTHD